MTMCGFRDAGRLLQPGPYYFELVAALDDLGLKARGAQFVSFLRKLQANSSVAGSSCLLLV